MQERGHQDCIFIHLGLDAGSTATPWCPLGGERGSMTSAILATTFGLEPEEGRDRRRRTEAKVESRFGNQASSHAS